MEADKSFSEFMVAAEAILGRRPNPDRAYEAFTQGVSPEVFARSLPNEPLIESNKSTYPPEPDTAPSEVPSDVELPRPWASVTSSEKGLLITLGVILLVVLVFSIWIPNEAASIAQRTSSQLEVATVSSPRITEAKEKLQNAIKSKDAQRLQSALANAKAIDPGRSDKDLQSLTSKAQALFTPLESSWKQAKREELRREEAALVSALEKATREKNKDSITVARSKSDAFKARVGQVTPAHAAARSGAERMLAQISEEEERASMNTYEGSPVGIAVGNLEIRRSFDGYSFDGNGRFVSVFVSAVNSGADSEHINPTNFTLETEDGYTVPYSAHTFSSSRPLEAVNIGPGATTSGWIVFESVLSRRYRLIHQPIGGERVVKVLVP